MNKNEVYIYKKPEELLQKLIRFNTTNPPGNEAECILYIKNILDEAGIENKILYKNEKRLNLYARIKGIDSNSPILMYGHVDVVDVKDQNWSVDPFEGVIKDGYVWGRGALDMKGPIAMMLSAFLMLKVENIKPSNDVILLILSDEEVDGIYGAKFITEEYKELLSDVKYAIGEIGGFTMYIGGKKFYPIMISEKQFSHVRVKVNGPSGHGSVPVKGGAMKKASDILSKLDKKSLPLHITPPVRQMIKELLKNLGFPMGLILRGLLNPYFANIILKLAGSSLEYFNVLLHNTVSPTIINGGNKINVIPSEVSIDLDCRIVPGESIDNLLYELKNLLGEDVLYEVITFDKGIENIDMSLFDRLSDIIKSMDDGIPIPFVIGGVTDARFFSKIGIQTYGFTPMKLPKEFDFSSLIHNVDERIPIDSLYFGKDAIVKLLLKIKGYRER